MNIVKMPPKDEHKSSLQQMKEILEEVLTDGESVMSFEPGSEIIFIGIMNVRSKNGMRSSIYASHANIERILAYLELAKIEIIADYKSRS
jgi:hypothetical protein